MSSHSILDKVKQLREITGVGFKDCKNAIDENNGDIEKSIEFLRIKGIAKANKKMERIAADGLICICEKENKFSILEVNSETDFVAKNIEFIKFVEEVSRLALLNSGKMDDILISNMENKKNVKDNLVALISKIGEKITIRRSDYIGSDQFINFSYVHSSIKKNLGKIGVLLSLETTKKSNEVLEFGKQLSMHIAATSPLSIDKEGLDKKILNKEKEIIIEELKNSGKDSKISEKIGRQISLVGRSMHRIYKAAKQCGYLNDLIEPIDPREAKKISREKIVYLCTGSQGEPNGAMMRISNYIHPDVMIESGDTVIFSSKIIPGNERKLYKLHNQLVKNGIEVISEENEFVHVSGHPNREDLKDMYNWVKPKSVIPVHGEHRHMIEHINFAKEMQVPYPVQVENGDIVQLFPGDKPRVIDKAQVGRIFVDGNISVGEESQSIKDRRNISYNGFLEITIIINNVGSLVKKPIITFKGLPSNGESNNFIFALEDKIQSICKSYSLNNFKQEHNLIEALRTNCRKTVKEKTGKRPYTNVNLVRI